MEDYDQYRNDWMTDEEYDAYLEDMLSDMADTDTSSEIDDLPF